MTTFHRLRVSAVHRDAADAVQITLDVPPASKTAFAFKPGQFLTLKHAHDGQEIRRTYSITSAPASGELSIAVRRVPGGIVSNALNDQVKAGDWLELMPPEGRFTLPDVRQGSETGSVSQYLGIAAGSGITPILSMIKHTLGSDPRAHFTLIYGNRTLRTMMFRDVLLDLKDQYLGRLALINVLSGEEPDVPMLAGRIDEAKLMTLLPALLEPLSLDAAFLCGPGTLIKEAMNALKALGVAREKIRFEFFTRGRPEGVAPTVLAPLAATLAGATVSTTQAQITVILDGRRHTFGLEGNETVIEGALRVGLSPPYSCRGGMCCTCRAKILEGSATMRANYSLDPVEAAAGFVLTCQAVPQSDRLILDYDAV